MSPASIAIVVTWLAGIAVVNHVRQRAPPGRSRRPRAKPGRPHRRVPHPSEPKQPKGSIRRSIVVFAFAALVTLGAGVLLEVAGSTLAERANVNGVIFGATVLAFATALPEISSGIAAVRLGDHQLAVADIFGGNAFQVCLFLVADLVAGQPVLPSSGDLNGWLAGLGIVLTVVYAFGVIVRSERCRLRLGADSFVVLGAVRARDGRALRHRTSLIYSYGHVRSDHQGRRPGHEPAGPQGDQVRGDPRRRPPRGSG